MTTKKNFSVNPNQSSSESLLKDIRRNTKRITKGFNCDVRNPWRA